MKAVCLYFQIHQPYRLRQYRFFNIGNDSFYFDEFANRSILKKVAQNCYYPANQAFLDVIKQFQGKFKLSYSISGVALDQFKDFEPNLIKSFKELADTGCVEFLAETYAHSLVSLINKKEFEAQVKLHRKLIKNYFGQDPEVFRNTELIYSDEIGKMVYDMGFKGILMEGAKHVLGWKSPNYLYCNAIEPKLKVLTKNFKLSDDIAFRFSDQGWSEWPLTADKYAKWLIEGDPKEDVINLFMDYETFGEHQWKDTGIFDFIKALPKYVLENSNLTFMTPSEVINNFTPVAEINVPIPTSWADEERDLTAWLGNNLQDDSFENLYNLSKEILKTENETLIRDWRLLQTSDHFYYMCTKWFADGDVHKYFNPYSSPYDAYTNFMNVMSDFEKRVKDIQVSNEEFDKKTAEKLIKQYKEEITRLKKLTE